MQKFDYDLLTIGAGSGGVRASRFAAGYGARVAVIEEQYLGGTCVNVGCIPKKLMSYAAHFQDDFHDSRNYGWSLGSKSFDWNTLLLNKDKEIARLNQVYDNLLRKSGVSILNGHATILDAHTVSVAGKTVSAKFILVATGGKSVVPDFSGAELGITSDGFFEMKGLPEYTVVVGGSYIAVELASILNGLGSKVTLLYRGAQLLRTMDGDLGVVLAREMEKKGIKFMFSTDIASIDLIDGRKSVMLNTGEQLDADCILFATGRRPNSDRLGLEALGVSMQTDGAIVVDAEFRTNIKSILAIGDVTGRIQLTPVALHEGMVVAANLFGGASSRMSYENVPTAVFSHPNVATVGLGESEARISHLNVQIFKSEFKPLKHTVSGSSERVFMKLVVDGDTDRVLGVHMVGAEAAEIVQGFTVALQCGATKAQFDAAIGIHPSTAEEFVTMRTAA